MSEGISPEAFKAYRDHLLQDCLDAISRGGSLPGRARPRDCINLKKRFGDRFKVAYEESYYAQYGANARGEDPWYMILALPVLGAEPEKHGLSAGGDLS